MIPHMRKMIEFGKKFVVDWDDNPMAVSPLSPHYKEWGRENVEYRWNDGEVIPLWVDGKNLEIKDNEKRIEYIHESMEMAHLITATTDTLAEVFSHINPHVKALPNCIDLNLWKRVPLVREDPNEIRLYWSGGSSHYEDWTLLEEPLIDIMKMYDNVKLYILGQLFKGAIRKLPSNRVVFHEWVDFIAYPYVSALINADISLIPLRDTPFNRCKSNIKWVEQGALEVPSVTSKVSPYMEYATDDNGIFVTDNSPEGWYKGIATLIEDEMLRKEMGRKAREYVVEHFDIATQYWRWVDMVKEVA
jgi:glycosyltransferase involved in cell wall biosynthesis